MSCVDPSLMLVFDAGWLKYRPAQLERLKNLGYKFNMERFKGYRFIPKKARELPLEDIPDWINQKVIEIPCGGCVACRLDYAQDWAIRCQFEAKLWKHNYFLTLSIDDEHLQKGRFGNPSLQPKDMKKFIHDLRQVFKRKFNHDGIRYILCGEYNSSGERMLNPHYHLILFNCPIPDLTFDFPCPEGGVIHKANSFGMPMFYSDMIAKLWKKGFIAIDDANLNTESYVSRYIMKKQKGQNADVYEKELGVAPPFLRMSNRPGLGFNMFINDFDKYIDDPMVIIGREGKKPLVTGLPKYYKRKLFEKDDSIRQKFEDDAKSNEKRMRSIRQNYGTTANQQRHIVEGRINSIAESFTRNN